MKYADWALGDFFRRAASHPFFDKTIFVVLGDHGARVYGADFIPIESYEIPLMIYSPKNIPARDVETAGCFRWTSRRRFWASSVWNTAPRFTAATFSTSRRRKDTRFSSTTATWPSFRGERMAILSTGKREAAYSYQPATRRFTEIPKEQASDPADGRRFLLQETGYDTFRDREVPRHHSRRGPLTGKIVSR